MEPVRGVRGVAKSGASANPPAMARHGAEDASVTALLGPTNTGKTHLAVDRMLAHRTGMMGFPLRLLAREVYDRVVAEKGAESVALVTGEEKRVPAQPRYFVCTVESMPLERPVEFVAVDEIQLAGDAERGHVFTDRLLRARGTAETMLLGADTMRPLIRTLVPEARFTGRPRLSTLAHAGHCKLARLAPRNAVVAFSTESVYALAERVRGLRGGCAVVLGALSPRTRNAQVALYQAGEVDSLVATDAIGMGLNLDLEHVAFSAWRKFDGRVSRMLGAAEIAQIAGRAGRHLRDGSFGTTGAAAPFEPDLIKAIEDHRFAPVERAWWRNADLAFDSLPALLDSLAAPPPLPGLRRTHDADDHRTLLTLARDPAVAATLTGADRVALLWEACRIPDFRKTMAEDHVALVRRVHLSLAERGRLPHDWVARSIERLAPTEGDIDTLTARISHVRTWTYVSHRADWVDDARGWQERTRALEDALSDALHARLTQLFVKRKARLPRHGLRIDESLFAFVGEGGEVTVEGERAGVFDGFRFCADAAARRDRVLLAAAHRTVEREVARRVAAAVADGDDAFALGLDPARDGAPCWGDIAWRGAAIARLGRGDTPLRPQVALIGEDHLSAAQRERVRRRLQSWLDRRLARDAGPLLALREAALAGPARGIAYALTEALGCLPRRALAPQIAALDGDGRRGPRRGRSPPRRAQRVRAGHAETGADALGRPAVVGLERRPASAARAGLGGLDGARRRRARRLLRGARPGAAGGAGVARGHRRAPGCAPAQGGPPRALRRRPRAAQARVVQAHPLRRHARCPRLCAGGHRHRRPGALCAQRRRPAPGGRRRAPGGQGDGPRFALRQAARSRRRQRPPVVTRDAPAPAAIRLDKWLWYARFFKTRGLAQKACEAGRIRVNGRRIAKAHRAVAPGDVLTFVQGRIVRIVRILALAERRGPAPEAQRLYEEIGAE